MNSKERVNTALDRKDPDMVPVGEWGIDHDIVEKIIGRKTYWRARARTTKALWAGKRDEVVESYKKDLVELIEKTDQDLVPVHLVPPKHLKPKEIKKIDDTTWEDREGRIYKYSSGNDAILCVADKANPVFQSKEEVREYFESAFLPASGFRIKERKRTGGYEFELADESSLELARHVISKLGDRKFIFAREFPQFNLSIGKNDEDFFLSIVLQPGLVEEFFNLITEVNIAAAKVFIDEGVDAIMPGGDFSDSTGPMVSPKIIREIFLPGMKRLSEYVRQAGVRIMSHNCGNNWKIMDLLIEAGYECLQSIQSKTADMDLKRLKERYGDRISFWGGINIETLHDGGVEENRQDVLYALRYAATGGGFILGSSNSVSYGSRYDNYMAALETLRQYGEYPIQIDLIEKALRKV